MEEVRIAADNKTSYSQKPSQPNKDKKKSAKRELLSILGVLILAPIIAIILTFFVFQSYVVDGPSMERTLYNNDRLIVWKAPKTWSSIFGSDYIPDRYSIIIFQSNGTGGVGNSQKQLIKRVIGLPGDRIVIKDGVVAIFNEENPDGFFPDRVGPEANVIGNTTGNIEYTVKEGEVYVLGDNRDNSLDSRSFGAIASEDIIGNLSVRIFPFDSIKKF